MLCELLNCFRKWWTMSLPLFITSDFDHVVFYSFMFMCLHVKLAAQVILDIKDIYHHSKDMHFSLKWMPIHHRIIFHKVTMLYKSVNDLTHNYMKDMFTYVQDSHSHTTRSSVKNGKHKELYIPSFAYSAKIWNSINPDIRNQQSLNCFKNTYIKNYFSV